METLFWISTGIILFTFVGYGIVISLLAKAKKRTALPHLNEEDLPEVTLMVAAYNEAEIIEQKVENCLSLDYPADKLHILFVTDGSDDGTPEFVQKHPTVKVLHQPERKGKIAAVNRAMHYVETELVVFTDANVMINPEGLRKMVAHFQNNLVGAVSGEKKVLSQAADGASAAGEGLYWKYESYLKRKDAEWNSLVGAAGELFAIRTHLHEPMEEDCLIEDFVMTMRIASQGYQVAYEPEAVATETASANITEETKRKVRIAAGGLQAIIKLRHEISPIRQPKLFFQYLSHRVLRWTLMPLAMIGALLSLSVLSKQGGIYEALAIAQWAFYALAWAGHLLKGRKIRIKGFFAPYYFVFMHICVVRGWFRYLRGQQQVTWEKAQRAVAPDLARA